MNKAEKRKAFGRAYKMPVTRCNWCKVAVKVKGWVILEHAVTREDKILCVGCETELYY